MTIIGIVGAIGSGKSHTQLKYGLKYANDREKQIVCNFLVDIQQIYRYACLPDYIELPFNLGLLKLECDKLIYALKFSLYQIFPFIGKPQKPKYKPLLPWIKRMIERGGGISQIPNPENLQALMIPESVVLLDEAGILLNAREFAKTPKELLADLAQSRKFGTDLIWCAQFDEQVDKQMRMLTQFFWHCSSLSTWDKKLKRPKLRYKTVYIFNADTYNEWSKNPRAKTHTIKTRFAYATMTYSGIPNKADLQIFKCFDSFQRLDLSNQRGKNRIHTIHHCRIKGNINRNLPQPEEAPIKSYNHQSNGHNPDLVNVNWDLISTP